MRNRVSVQNERAMNARQTVHAHNFFFLEMVVKEVPSLPPHYSCGVLDNAALARLDLAFAGSLHNTVFIILILNTDI